MIKTVRGSFELHQDKLYSSRTCILLYVRFTCDQIFVFFIYSFSKFRLEGFSYSVYSMSVSEALVLNNSEEKCPYDGVFVFDESSIKRNTSEYLGVFCGVLDDRLPEVKSKTNVMYVQFITDSAGTKEGFAAKVSFIYGEYLF